MGLFGKIRKAWSHHRRFNKFKSDRKRVWKAAGSINRSQARSGKGGFGAKGFFG